MMPKPFLAAALFLGLSAAACAQAPDTAKLDAFFDRLAEKHKAMGSLTIARDGNVVYSRAIGYGEISATGKKPLTAANRFRIGSITKMFTTVMILQLVDEGKVKRSDTLDKFLPQVPNASKITLGHILAHRSGIPNVRRDRETLGEGANTMPITKEEMLALIMKATPDFEPDSKHAYSNTGYFVLGLILEKVTGKSYGELLAEKITSKLGLKDTYVATGKIDVSKNESLTYFRLAGEWRQSPETHPSLLFGAGAIISTPNDLAGFIHALFELKLVSKESLDGMKSIRDGDGLGMESFTFAGKTFYGHTGGADNYGAWLAYQPEDKVAVAYTSNAKVHPVGNIVSAVVDIYYNKPFQIPSFEAFEVSADILDTYVGLYSAPGAPGKLTISRQGGTLFFQPPGSSSVPLEATAQNRFQIEGAVVIEFDAEKKQMTIKRRGGERVLTKEN